MNKRIYGIIFSFMEKLNRVTNPNLAYKKQKCER